MRIWRVFTESVTIIYVTALHTIICNSYIIAIVYLGKSPMVWKNLKKGRHVITLRAFCTDDEGEGSTIARRKFKFRIRK